MICRVCDSSNLELALDLGMQPWANNFLKASEVGTEPFYPLHVLFCHDCATTQLDYTVKKEVMFGDHTYLSGITKSLDEHFRIIAEEVNDRFFKCVSNKSVMDIGSNDGTQLKHYLQLGYDVLGVESSITTAKIANEAGIETANVFFNESFASSLNRKFDVINASGIFFHLEELHSVTDGIRCCLKDDGIFVVQFLYMKSIVENLAFDQIYHEHLLYYTIKTIETLLERHGLQMFDAYLSPIHGGSIIGYITHAGKHTSSERLIKLRVDETRTKINAYETYCNFAKRIITMKAENRDYLLSAHNNGKSIYGFGAPVKGNTLLNYFEIGPDIVEYLVEKNELRRGLYSPGMHIPIVIERELERLPDIYYVLAWNFRTEILANNKHLIEQGIEFYFPVIPVGA
jgi:2-polyprenyl-3-methyl-5-hydroxy-6-metoxy-1,4-benzoquinol methylase